MFVFNLTVHASNVNLPTTLLFNSLFINDIARFIQ